MCDYTSVPFKPAKIVRVVYRRRDILPSIPKDAPLAIRILECMAAATLAILATPMDFYMAAFSGEPDNDYVYNDY